MSDDRDHTIATATVTSEETPYGVRINTGGHALRGDEPVDHGGPDSGPAPFGLLSGLGACTAITLRMYAEHQSWPLAGVNVELTYVVKDRDTRWIDRLITLHGVDEDQRAKLVGFQNSATGPDLGFYAARSYSLMRPPRTGRRWIRSWERSATGWSGRGGRSWRLRCGRRPL